MSFQSGRLGSAIFVFERSPTGALRRHDESGDDRDVSLHAGASRYSDAGRLLHCRVCLRGRQLRKHDLEESCPGRRWTRHWLVDPHPRRGVRVYPACRPETYLLENPYRKTTLEALFTAAARVPDYAFAAVVINSTVVRLPASRPRMYLIGVDLRSRVLLLPFSKWVDELQSILGRFRSKAPSAEAYVLPSSAEAVRECRIALAARRARGQCAWPKEKKKHQAVRRVLATVHGFNVPPLTADASVPGMINHQWFRLLSDRMQDVAAVWRCLAGIYSLTKLCFEGFLLYILKNRAMGITPGGSPPRLVLS